MRIPIASRSSASRPAATRACSPRRSQRYRPRAVAMASGAGARRRRGAQLGGAARAVTATGSDGLIAVATHPDVDLVLCASSGTAALEAVLAAIDAGKTIALANKEVLVMAGGLVMDAARARAASRSCRSTASTTPFISACTAARRGEVRRLILTASGGPFRGRTCRQPRDA